MNIYELGIIDLPKSLEHYNYFLVVASSARNARRMAAKYPDIRVGVVVNPEFLDRKLTSCLKLGEVTGRYADKLVGIRMASI